MSIHEEAVAPLRNREIFDALTLLRPYDTPTMQKIRVGPNHDGGYVLLDDLDNTSFVYSYGIGGQVEFEEELGSLGKPCFMYDHTIPGLPYEKPYFHYFHEGIAGDNISDQNLFTLEHHIKMNGHTKNKDLLLKCDVEGAEYEAINATNPDTLLQFRQIVIELHWLTKLTDTRFKSNFISAIAKLNSLFTLCHVHSNNCAPVHLVDGYVVADVLELTYIRSDLIERHPSATVYPTGLDHANAWWREDNLLWFYPFLPTYLPDKLSTATFNSSLVASVQTRKTFVIEKLEEEKLRLADDTNRINERIRLLSEDRDI